MKTAHEKLQCFLNAIENILCNHKLENHKKLTNDLKKSYKTLGCNISFQIHVLDTHLYFFPTSLDANDGKDEIERFHHGIFLMEKLCRRKISPGMLAHYCGRIKRLTKRQIFTKIQSIYGNLGNNNFLSIDFCIFFFLRIYVLISQ